MTSNIGAQKIAQQKNLGFGTGSVQEQNMKREVQKDLKEYFRPEFLNRIDEILFFQYLTRPQLEQIGSRMIGQLQSRLKEIGVDATIDSQAVTYLLKQKEFDPAEGARPLKKCDPQANRRSSGTAISDWFFFQGRHDLLRIGKGTDHPQNYFISLCKPNSLCYNPFIPFGSKAPCALQEYYA